MPSRSPSRTSRLTSRRAWMCKVFFFKKKPCRKNSLRNRPLFLRMGYFRFTLSRRMCAIASVSGAVGENAGDGVGLQPEHEGLFEFAEQPHGQQSQHHNGAGG